MNPNRGELDLLAGNKASMPALQWKPERRKREMEQQPAHLLPTGLSERTMRHMAVRDFMARNPSRVGLSASVAEAVQVMQSTCSPCLFIVEDESPVAVVSEGDMMKILTELLASESPAQCPLIHFCEQSLATLRETDSLYVAVERSREPHGSFLPVVDEDDRLTGLLSREAIYKAQLAAVEKERDDIRRQVYNRSRELREVNRELQALALQDGLLKVGNRRAMEADVQSSHMNAVRYGQTYALALIDVDFFKRFNDRYGHCAGDRALITVATCVKESIRRGDRVYRYGGEELLILMPETSLEEASEALWRLANKLYCLNVPHDRSPHRRLTISAGVSAFDHSNDGKQSWEQVLEEADTYLYQAKALGRNRVCAEGQAAPSLQAQHS